MPPFLATVAILCPRHCAPMASSCLPPPPAKRGHTWAGSMRWLHCKLPWEFTGIAHPTGCPQAAATPTHLFEGPGGQAVLVGRLFQQRGWGTLPPPLQSHLGKALAKHLLVPEGFPCEVCNVQTQPANPPRQVPGTSCGATRAREERVGRRMAYLCLRAAGSRGAGTSPGAGGLGWGPVGPATKEAGSPSGPPGQCPSFLFSSHEETACWHPQFPLA